MQMREGIILAGGFGTRLRQVVPDLPKPMAPIAGRPFLEILLRKLAAKGFQRIVLSVGFMADKIYTYFGDHFASIELLYTTEKIPLGTGGAVRLAMDKCGQDHVFIFNGDTYTDLEIDALEGQWEMYRRPIIVCKNVADITRYGCVVVEKNRVVGFSEKGLAGPGLINAGCYVLNRGQLDALPIYMPFSLEADYLPRAVQENTFDVFVTAADFIDIGVPEDYARAQTELLGL